MPNTQPLEVPLKLIAVQVGSHVLLSMCIVLLSTVNSCLWTEDQHGRPGDSPCAASIGDGNLLRSALLAALSSQSVPAASRLAYVFMLGSQSVYTVDIAPPIYLNPRQHQAAKSRQNSKGSNLRSRGSICKSGRHSREGTAQLGPLKTAKMAELRHRENDYDPGA